MVIIWSTADRFRLMDVYTIRESMYRISSVVWTEDVLDLKKQFIFWSSVSSLIRKNFPDFWIWCLIWRSLAVVLSAMLLWREPMPILWMPCSVVFWLSIHMMTIRKIFLLKMYFVSLWNWLQSFLKLPYILTMHIAISERMIPYLSVIRRRGFLLPRTFFLCFARMENTQNWKQKFWILHWSCMLSMVAVITPLSPLMW